MTSIFLSPLIPREAILLHYVVIARAEPDAISYTRIKRLLRRARFAAPAAGAGVTRGNIMEIGETIYVITREEFRKWLQKNHSSKKEIWLIKYKKATKKPSIDYVEAVEEGICFGWIDGFEKGMDEE